MARHSGRTRHADDARTNFEIDYARVIHAGSFRRLQGKTQILSLGDDDFYRTRLTHSMEVAQIAEGIVQMLRRQELQHEAGACLPTTALIHAIGLAHDIGHPPFGHGGELALNYCMRGVGGFEGNAQTLRILGRLEAFSDEDGADLTRRALLGVLKYPALVTDVVNADVEPRLTPSATTIAVLDGSTCKPAKSYYEEERALVDWILEPLTEAERIRFQTVERSDGRHGKTLHKSFDCTIMDVADDIAYGVHDLEDAIALGFISESDFREAITTSVCSELIAALADRPLGQGPGGYEGFVRHLFGGEKARKSAIGRLVHHFIRGATVVEEAGFAMPLVALRARLRDAPRALLTGLQKLIVRKVIDDPRVQHLEFKGQQMVIAVFEALRTDPRRLLPGRVSDAFESAEEPLRILCDHVASFTDASLLRTYERLFSPRSGSVFDRI